MTHQEVDTVNSIPIQVRCPTVFISYSHDSPEHKRWVLELATWLMQNGINVQLDSWDVRPGDSLQKFMERGVSDADRVLMICTEDYVAKANDGLGGVAYEEMIIAGTLIKNSGLAKFIPVIRQTGHEYAVPVSVSSRRYVNLSEGSDSAAARDELLRELHDIPPSKPALGSSPYSRSHATAITVALDHSPSEPTDAAANASPDSGRLFDQALAIAEGGSVLQWRRIVGVCRSVVGPALQTWWKAYGSSPVTDAPTLTTQSLEGASAFAPLIAVAMAGIASGKAPFERQAALLNDILNPAEWQLSGLVVRVEIPEFGAFLYQALFGAMALHLNNLTRAIGNVRVSFPSRTVGKSLPLWRHHNVMVWPLSLGRDASTAWRTLQSLPERWPWVHRVFGASEDYQAALYAYYVALNVIEYTESLCTVGASQSPLFQADRCDIPPVFEIADDSDKRRGYELLRSTGPQWKEFWSNQQVDETTIRRHWPEWVALQNSLSAHWNPLGKSVSFESLVPEILDALP